jgi:D-alanyl-D-alanine carboxypeptidase (penicillin-binding protein 5/6)
VFARFVALVLGAVIAVALIVGMQIPLLHPVATAHVSLAELHLKNTEQPLAWPSVGSAAVVIPALGVERSWHNSVQPIASLTKLMTAYVALKKLPLAHDETGPCLTISSQDVSTYEEMKVTDQSSVAVEEGESLCEIDLLNGLLVHSASNYAVLLAQMVTGSVTSFVSLMNQTASALGLRGTHYDDVSGFSDLSVSTALDQGRLAALLMRSPLVRAIVAQSTVTLPYAGSVGSFTPDLGVDNVIGVKSGRTADAGGCDVMAMTFVDGSSTKIAYAVVLGQQGGDLLGPAGEAALALDQSATTEHTILVNRGTVVGNVGWGSRRTDIVVGHVASFSWWTAKDTLRASVHLRRISSALHAGEVVGYVQVAGASGRRVPLIASNAAAPPSLWQRVT